MIFNVKITPYAKVPKSMDEILVGYLSYRKNRNLHPKTYKNLEDRIVDYCIIALGETVLFVFRVFTYVVWKIKVYFGIEVKGAEKYFQK